MSGLLIMLFSITTFADINKDLIKAAKKGKVENVYQLIKNGADVNVKGRKNMTPLHLASLKGHNVVVIDINFLIGRYLLC
ncbi:MAG: ankyrin repeat domain-containing protein [Deltaproteobacteria bacterium]|nr:ankyrin repeat domain-containing protein [Deltaproteobacteria bacterium]